jgi:hypothetical protein
MFGSNRRRATDAASQAVRPIVAAVQHNYGLPPHFWTDPFVLGFITTVITFHAKLVTGGRIEGAGLGRVTSDVIASVSNMNGSEILSRVTALTQADPDFGAGADNAVTICLYTLDRLKSEGTNPLVTHATRAAEQIYRDLGTAADRRSSIAAMMLMIGFVEEVRKRFGLTFSD